MKRTLGLSVEALAESGWAEKEALGSTAAHGARASEAKRMTVQRRERNGANDEPIRRK
jgi:hypothetical protein